MRKSEVTLILLSGATVAEAAAAGLPMLRLNNIEYIGPFDESSLPAAEEKLRALASKNGTLRVFYLPAQMQTLSGAEGGFLA